MKSKILLLLLPLLLLTSGVFAQCNDQLLTLAMGRLKDYNYVKDFKVRMKKGKKGEPVPSQRTTIIMNSGFRYKIFNISAEEFNTKLIAEFFSQEGLLAATYSPDTKKHYEAIEFECKKTGVYYLSLYFEGGREGCGISVLAVETEDAKRERMLNSDR